MFEQLWTTQQEFNTYLDNIDTNWRLAEFEGWFVVNVYDFSEPYNWYVIQPEFWATLYITWTYDDWTMLQKVYFNNGNRVAITEQNVEDAKEWLKNKMYETFVFKKKHNMAIEYFMYKK